MLQVENLYKSFGDIKAVDGLSFKVARGEVVGLLGPNGAGKTTAMRLVTSFLKPDQGSITVNDIDVLENPQLAKTQIGYLPENAPSYHDMEVTDFLLYSAELRQIPKNQRQTSLKETIDLCGLGEVVGRPIGELSRGFKQRVCLGQTLIHKPKLLILDEPTTGLDPHQIQEIRGLIKEIGKERTVILSTHIMQEVQAVCQKALIISKGKLVGEGTLEEIIKKGRGRARYFAKIKAPMEELEKQFERLSGFEIEGLQSSNGLWQTLVMECAEKEDRSEEIFHWVVNNQWSLSELRCESTSLEDVFLELTK